MADTKARLTLNSDAVIELDVLKGTLGRDIIDTRSLDPKGMLTFSPGFTSTAPRESRITSIDDDEDVLLRRGFPTGQLATESSYLRVYYTLLHGEKPAQEEYDEFKTAVTRRTTIHEQITCLFHGFRRDSHPMVIMCGVTGAPAAFCHDSLGVNNARHREIAVFRLPSGMPIIVTMYYKYPVGQPFVYPHNGLSCAGNLLNMMFSIPYEKYEVNPILGRATDRILILRADHEQNASTSTVHIAGSSGANPFAYIMAGIASLWGLAHDGTNETTLKMLEEVSSVKRIPKFIHCAKDENNSFRLMSFGHHIYKNYDPCATIMREACHEALEGLSTKDDLLEVTMELEYIMLSGPHLIEKKLYPNVDLYSGIILKAMGIPSSVFTVIFAMARTAGWIAHWNEMHIDGMKITHPCQLYTGYDKHDSKSDIKR